MNFEQHEIIVYKSTYCSNYVFYKAHEGCLQKLFLESAYALNWISMIKI